MRVRLILIFGLSLLALGLVLDATLRCRRAPAPSASAVPQSSEPGLPTGLVPAPQQAEYSLPQPSADILPINLDKAVAYLADNTRSSSLDHALKDELMANLNHPSVSASYAAETLLSLFEDRAIDPVVREYALQHLRPTYKRLALESQESCELRDRILQSLHAALLETESSMAGTALIALGILADVFPDDVDAEAVRDTALALVEDESASDRARLTAFAVLGRRGEQLALPTVLAVAGDPSRSAPLRIAAIAALGELGGEDALAMIEPLLEDPHFGRAARRAVERIDERKREI